ncbi:hypothetical protein [Bacillus velezensis]|uniref:hypothetical protein n=1 Tax=Bacillus velezensis TaxID=492670 RepID=UPI0020C17803|nr:hypothetical protein [Bacillus velezensis]
MKCSCIQTDECEVLIDSYTRYVKGLQPIDIPEHDNGSVTYQKGGIYIITGGAGKLGLLFAEHIANENPSRDYTYRPFFFNS